MIMATIMIPTAAIIIMSAEAGLYRLLTWLSPSYPVGAYSYSHGLEYAVEGGWVADRAGLVAFVTAALEQGAGWTDAGLFVAAWRAGSGEPPPYPSPARGGGDSTATLPPPRAGEGRGGGYCLPDILALASAWRGSAEMALESAAQGRAFLIATRAAWPHPGLDALAAMAGGDVALPVAVAVAAALHGIALAPALAAYLHGFAANLVSAGLRLVPLGQTDGQRALAELEPVVAAVASAALTTPLDEIGTAAPMLDWFSMRHETQYTRLFRS